MQEQDINRIVGQRLRSRRTSLGLTQEAVATGIGVAAQQVQKYESGVNVMNVNRLYQFAEFLDVPVGYFFEDASVASFSGATEEDTKPMSDRESIEIIKSFRGIKDHALRKRLADLLRTLSQKEI